MDAKTEDRLAGAKAQGQAQFDSIREMVEDLQKAREEANDVSGLDRTQEMEQRIHEDALSVEVRSGWFNPSEFTQRNGGRPEVSEYRILLCTGGPAVQITGELSEHCEPETARMEVQDWFQPWTAFRPLVVERDGREVTEHHDSEAVLLAYARCFWFGE